MKASSRLVAGISLLALLLVIDLWWQGRSERPAPSTPAANQIAPAPAVAMTAPPAAALAPTPAVPSLAPVPPTPFHGWAEKYQATSVDARGRLLDEGRTLAEARRAEMLHLIKTDPASALARALPYRLRKDLPPEIAEMIEQPVSGRGEFEALYSTPIPGRESAVPPTEYRVTLDKTIYQAFAYGPRRTQRSRENVYLHGVALADVRNLAAPVTMEDGQIVKTTLERFVALSAEATRFVDGDEAKDLIQAGQARADAICGVSGQAAVALNSPAMVEFGGRYYQFCQFAHAVKFNDRLNAMHQHPWASGGFVPANANTDNLQPPGNSGTQGRKRLLYMPVMFADDPRPPQTPDGAQATAAGTRLFYKEGSYGTVDWETTVTPPIQLSQRANFYGEFLGLLRREARAVAGTMGYLSREYDQDYVLFNNLPQAMFGGRSDGLLNASPGALSHELGHNFGLPHANYWDVSGATPLPVQPTNGPPLPIDPDGLVGHYHVTGPYGRSVQEYGNPFDVMGSGPGHFSAYFKNLMNWLPEPFVKTVGITSTTNRIYAFDTPRIQDGRLYAMRIYKDYARDYWASFRQGFSDNPWLSDGIELDWNFFGNNLLLDTTAATSFDKADAALIVGRTFSDETANIHLTPIARGGGPEPWEKWVDVVVQIGPFPGNQPPTMALDASALIVTNGATVSFTVTAQDPDGDQLAYSWDFGDLTFGVNTPTISKTFTTNGQYVVRSDVSDMKGGVVSAYRVITVGTPGTFTINGRVLDSFGNPLRGVRVHNSGARPPSIPPAPDGVQTNSTPTQIGSYRYGYTDSDGYYTIGNIPVGIYTNRAFIYGYRTEPLDFADPVSLTNGNAYGLNFVANPLTRVRIERVANAEELLPNSGVFTATREGDLSDDLHVRYNLSGGAVPGTDYAWPPGNLITNTIIATNMGVVTTNFVTTNVPIGQIIIPAGLATADLIIDPIDNMVGDGSKSVVLTLLLQTNLFRITTTLTNILTTNNMVIITNTMFVSMTNQYSIPGWEPRTYGPDNTLTWFQTDPTYVLGTAEAAIDIVDDDPANVPLVGVIALDTDAIETRGDSAMVAFFRLSTPLTNELTLYYTVSGAAGNGVDFQTLPGAVKIPVGEFFTLVPVYAINDLFVEGNETATITVTDDPSYVVGLPDDTIVVVDDDLPLVSIFAADSTAGNGGNVGRVTISRSGDLTGELLVNYLVSGTASSGQDYNTLSGAVTIPADGISADVVITPINNPTSQLPKTVTISLSDTPEYNIYSQNSATITIVDGSLPTVLLEVTTDTAQEGGSPGTFRFTRTGSVTNSLWVNFAVGGSAWEGSDYAALGTNVLIPAGAAAVTVNVLPIPDFFRELGDVSGEDNVHLQLLPGTNYLVGNPNRGTVIIQDDDPARLPAVGFMLRNSVVREDGLGVDLAVKISANPETNLPVVVEYRITGGSALPNVNYTPIPGVTGILNFVHFDPPMPPGTVVPEDGIQFVSIPVLNDNSAAGNKTFTVTLSNPVRYMTNFSVTNVMGMNLTNIIITPIPTNAFLADSRTHTVTIIDVGVTTVTITAGTPRAYESGPVAGTFLITRTGPTNAPLTVAYVVTGTAASGNDFAPFGTNSTVTIPAGTNTVRLNLAPLDDPTEEVAESVTVTLLVRPGYRVGTPGNARIILVSEDGTLQFTTDNFNVSEDAGPALVTVRRTGDTNLILTVDFVIANGTATNGVDYLGTNGTLSFGPGEVVKSIVIDLINDDLVEPTETVSLALANPSGGVPLGGQRTATLSIVNDDTSFAFATNLFRVNENSGTGALVIQRSGVTNGPASVSFVTSNNTARAGSDYTDTRLTVNFAPGQTSAVVAVPILDDTLFEGNESVDIVLSNPGTNASLGTISNSVMSIIDDECSLSFTAGNYDVDEYAGFAVVTVHREGGTVNPVSLRYATRVGAASNNVDYIGVSAILSFAGDAYVLNTNGSGELSFQPGDADRTILIQILDDVIGEGSETFGLRLTNAVGPVVGSTILGATTNATVTIIDNETPGNVEFEYSTGLGANARVRSVAFQQNQRVVFGGDFTLFHNVTLHRVARLTTTGLLDPSFNPGAGANGSVNIVAVQPDERVLIGGTFTMVDLTNRVRLARLTADGALDLSFNPGTGPNAPVRAMAVQPDGRILIAGEFTTVAGTARPYLARLNANGAFDPSLNAVVNGPVYAVAVQPDGAIVLGGAFTSVGGTARGRIARVSSTGALDLAFDPGTGANHNVNTVAVQPDGKVLLGGLFTSIHTATYNFLARLNSDGTPDTGFNVGLGPNAGVNSVSVHVNGKIAIGGDFSTVNGVSRNYFARLRSNGTLDVLFDIGTGANAPVQTTAIQSNSAVIIGGDFTTVDSIPRGRIARVHGDEKSNIPTVEFGAAVYAIVETNGPANITVVRGGNTNVAFTVQFLVAPGTATSGSDYNGTGSTLGFAPGETVKTFSVQILDDTEFELDETIFLTLTNATPGVDTSGLLRSTLVIVDNEKGVQFSAADYFVAEEATNAFITVVRSGQLNGTVSVQFATVGGTATPGVDYIGTNTTLVFTNAESTKVVAIALLDDNSGEADETVLLTLTNPTGAVTNAPFVSTLWITNSDQTFGTFNFSSTNKITIIDGSPAVPYPSTIEVSGLTGVVARVAVTLVGLTHTFPADIDMLLVGPGGRSSLVMSDAGGTFDVNSITLRLDDAAATALPLNGQIGASSYRPTDYETGDTFAAPAPAGLYGSAFSAFAGGLPNGSWALYVMDDRGADVGIVSEGWRLEIITVDPALTNDLGMDLVESADPVLAGQPLTYTVSVTNIGPLAATNVRVTDVLPANVTFLSASASCTNVGGTVTCSLGTLSVGATAQVTLTMRPLKPGSLTNTAAVVSSLPDVVAGNSSATVTTTVSVAPVADLELGIADLPDPVLGGSNIVYTISLTNNGPLAATAVVVTDVLPASLAYVSGTTASGVCNVIGNNVTCNLGDMASGARATVTLVARTLAAGLITNSVSASSGVPDFTPALASAVTTVQSAADLRVYQIESDDPVALGGTLTYTIVVTNLGVSTATAVNLIDTLPSGATFVSAFPSQGACAQVANILICDLGSITNRGVVTVSLDVQPVSLSPLINSVNVGAFDFDPNSTNNFSTEITSVFALGSQSLFITPSTDANALAAAVTSGGATGIRVSSVNLQAHTQEGATSSGLFSIGPPPFTYNLTQPGIVLSTGGVKDYESGPNLFSGNTTAFGGFNGVPATGAQEALLEPITGVATLAIDHFDVTQLDIRFDMLEGFNRIEFKVVFGSEEYAEFVGSPFIDGFGIYLNGSNIAYTAGIPINIDHPSMVALPGTELDGVLAPGGNPVLTFSANVPSGSTSNLLTFIVADTSDAVLDTTVYVSSLQGGVGPNTDLSVGGTAAPEPVKVGENLTYTFTIQNRGPNDATNVVVLDTLPSTLAFVSATASQGSCAHSNGTVACALGAMARSTAALITLVTTPTAATRITNSVSVSSELLDLRLLNNSVRVVGTAVEPGAFSSTTAVILADAAPSFAYPSTIEVSGLAGLITGVTVTLVELSHSFPADLDIALVGPAGQKVMLMSDAGAGFDLNGGTLKFDDAAPTTLSQLGQLASGTYRPTDYEPGDLFVAPGPEPPFGTMLAVFNGTMPNGVWSLYIMDDRGVDSGVIAAGWRLNLQTPGSGPPPVLAATLGVVGANLVISWPDTAVGYALYSSSSLGAMAVWTIVGATPVQGGGFYTVTIPLAGAGAFFRLQGP